MNSPSLYFRKPIDFILEKTDFFAQQFALVDELEHARPLDCHRLLRPRAQHLQGAGAGEAVVRVPREGGLALERVYDDC